MRLVFRCNLITLFATLLCLNIGCANKDRVSSNYEVILKIHGSSTIGTKLIPALAGLHLKEMGAKRINFIQDKSSSDNIVVGDFGKRSKAIAIRKNGSASAMSEIDKGECDICMSFESGVDVTDLQQKVIGYDAMVAIVNRNNPIGSLELENLEGILGGAIANWSQLNIDDLPEITLYMSDEAKHDISSFRGIVLGEHPLTSRIVFCKDDQEIASKVEKDVNGFGMVSMAFIGQNKVLKIKSGKSFSWYPERLNVSSMDYPFTRRVSLFSKTKKSEVVDKFFQTAFSWNGRSLVDDAGFVVKVSYADSSNLRSKWEDFDKEVGSARRISVSFRYANKSSELDSLSGFDLARLSDFLDERFSNVCSIILMGFTDSIGSSSQNKDISIKRASVVADYIKEKAGFSVSGIYGFGDMFPVGPNVTEWGRERNRRVEVWLNCVSDTVFSDTSNAD